MKILAVIGFAITAVSLLGVSLPSSSEERRLFGICGSLGLIIVVLMVTMIMMTGCTPY